MSANRRLFSCSVPDVNPKCVNKLKLRSAVNFGTYHEYLETPPDDKGVLEGVKVNTN